MNKRLIKSNDEGGGGASFNTVTYIGDGTTNNPITSVGFEPDLVWIKNRDYSGGISHQIFDSVRGDTAGSGGSLSSNNTNAEYFDGTKGVKSFNIDGFTLDGGVNGEYGVNGAPGGTFGSSYVAWCWKAGGYANTFNVLENGSTTSSATAAGAGITAGSNTNGWSVSANRDAGFNIVKYTGNGIDGATVGHGFTEAPDVIITKGRSGFDPITNWCVYHSSLGAGTSLYLNSTAYQTATGNWNGTSPTSSVFSLSSIDANGNGTLFVAYCFKEVAGFSKFGSYTGNGTSTGPLVDLGFEPAFVMVKNASSGNNWHRWYMFDNKRDTVNPNTLNLAANTSDAEPVSGDAFVDFLENGFQVKTGASPLSVNQSENTYIYMAFANQF
jgi:hypothetical protein